MIYVKGKCIYLCTPYTASRSTSDALRKQCGGVGLSKSHHAELHDMPKLLQYDVPVITTIRDPRDLVLNRYIYRFRTPSRREFFPLEKFIPICVDEFHTNHYGLHFGSMATMFCDYCSKIFLFERGIQQIFDYIGCEYVEPEHIGRWNEDCDSSYGPRIRYEEISDRAKDLIESLLAKEIQLYEDVKANQ